MWAAVGLKQAHKLRACKCCAIPNHLKNPATLSFIRFLIFLRRDSPQRVQATSLPDDVLRKLELLATERSPGYFGPCTTDSAHRPIGAHT